MHIDGDASLFNWKRLALDSCVNLINKTIFFCLLKLIRMLLYTVFIIGVVMVAYIRSLFDEIFLFMP